MRNKRKIIIIFGIILSILLAAGGTYAVWVWISDVDKNLVMNTMSGLDNNIIYDDGEAKFIGDFSPTDKFCESEYNTISFYKTGELENRDVNATIYMEVAAIGENIAASNDVYWVLTEGDNTINCDDMFDSSSILSYGNFNGFEAGESIELLSDIYVTTEIQKFTVWIWIDNSSSNLSSLSGETIHANVWTEFEVLGRTKYVVNLDPNGGILNTSAVLKEYNNYGSYVYSAPYTGEYILEVWGAQGGSYNDTYHGGYGGYSVGNISLNENQQLHVNVGGSGSGGYVTAYEGGYNGGGSTKASANTNVYNSSGGGATHIATKIGVLSSLSSDTSSILIVAGGGGGAHYHSSGMSAGGSGGGITGGSPTNATMVSDKCIAPTGGTQTTAGINYNYNSSAGSFGLGGNYKDRYGGGGGGGYYGGASGGNADNCAYSGAGGSGYIGNSLLTNKAMYCYNCDISTDVNTLTYTTTNVSETAISNYAKRGTGAARITFKNSLLVRGGDKYSNLPTPTREGYMFLGWFTEPTGGVKVDNNTKMSINENHTLYAQWKEYGVASNLYNDGILQIGDFINYELGEWTENKMSLIKTGPINSLVSANNQNSLPTEEFQFGGFVVGSDIGGNSFTNWLISNYGYNDYLVNADTLEDISGWRVFDVLEDGSIILISAGNPENYVHPYATQKGYVSEYILTGNINDDWGVTAAGNYKIRNWDMYKNTNQYAIDVSVLTKSKLENWYSKYIIENADISDKQTFRLIYDSQYGRYHNLVDNWSYYWVPGFGNSSRMYCFVPEDREIASPPQTFAFGIRILIKLSSDALIFKEPIDTITITTNSDDYYGDEILEQTYNRFELC